MLGFALKFVSGIRKLVRFVPLFTKSTTYQIATKGGIIINTKRF